LERNGSREETLFRWERRSIKSSLKVENTITSRDRVCKVGSARTGELGRLQLVLNLDLGDWREFKEMIL
jgi:hypothetical protein